jgi:phospholipid-binding lipoprotein MlaA
MTSTSTDAENNDPFEPMNRRVHRFNFAVDGAVIKPIVKGYTNITPDLAEKAVSNFSANLGDPAVALNQFLQGNMDLGIQDSARFIFNSTFGLGGLIDMSTLMGLAKHEEDFGQTLAVWGLGAGPHINVPLWGPSNLRDGVGSIVDTFVHPLAYLEDHTSRNAMTSLLAADKRASLFSTEELITGDAYLFIRDAYNQRREHLIKNGEVEDAFLDGEE